MKRQIAILIIVLMIMTPIIQDVSAAKTVFITSDNIINQEQDTKMLNSLKNHIEDMSNGSLQVIVDNQAPSPGEGWRAIEVTSDISICLAASDAGNFLQLVKSTTNSSKQIVFVNTGDYNLDNHSNYLRRAWDDNYSNESLAGLHDPGTFLKNAGIYYIQPLSKFPNNGPNGYIDKYDEEMTKEIAQETINIINKHNNNTKLYSDGLVSTNVVKPSVVASACKELLNSNDTKMDGKYGNYSGPQLLYQTSAYLNGNGLENVKYYDEPENPMGISFFNKNTYSVYDYFKMGGIVKQYMDENGRAPDSIEYEGAQIGYYDLLYNFAEITQNHTDSKHMGFEKEYKFDKVNDSILLHLLPFILIFFVLLIAYLLFKRIKRF